MKLFAHLKPGAMSTYNPDWDNFEPDLYPHAPMIIIVVVALAIIAGFCFLLSL